jgi:hypothetical protein
MKKPSTPSASERLLAPASQALIGMLVLVSCRSVVRGSAGDVIGAKEPAATAVSPPVLPQSCIEFLERLQCWLRASGNAPADIDRAVSNTRASFTTRPKAAESCEHAVVFRTERFASAGCVDPGADARSLPPGVRAECAPGEFFFVRQDGHVSGCHRDCAVPEDCPSGSSCTASGSAAGGPIDEPFCE